MTYRIVVGVDGSSHSASALRWALDEAEKHSGEVTAVFSWQIPFLSFPGAFDRDDLETAAKAFVVETVKEIAPSPAVPLHTLVAEGEATESLLAAAEGADLLVVGTRGRSRFPGLRLGAVSLGVAGNATCPVVLVKEDDEAPA
jgi:nucleotide-binding universal stress UspA family protein